MTRSTKKRSSLSKVGLETYAFWTGFASTLISLAQVLIQAVKR